MAWRWAQDAACSNAREAYNAAESLITRNCLSLFLNFFEDTELLLSRGKMESICKWVWDNNLNFSRCAGFVACNISCFSTFLGGALVNQQMIKHVDHSFTNTGRTAAGAVGMMVVAETLKQLHFPFYFLGSVSPEILFFRLRRWRWCSPALALPCMLLLSIWHTVLKRSKGYKWF